MCLYPFCESPFVILYALIVVPLLLTRGRAMLALIAVMAIHIGSIAGDSAGRVQQAQTRLGNDDSTTGE